MMVQYEEMNAVFHSFFPSNECLSPLPLWISYLAITIAFTLVSDFVFSFTVCMFEDEL